MKPDLVRDHGRSDALVIDLAPRTALKFRGRVRATAKSHKREVAFYLSLREKEGDASLGDRGRSMQMQERGRARTKEGGVADPHGLFSNHSPVPNFGTFTRDVLSSSCASSVTSQKHATTMIQLKVRLLCLLRRLCELTVTVDDA